MANATRAVRKELRECQDTKLINRKQIAKMAGCSVEKVAWSCVDKEFNTPKHKPTNTRFFLYDKAEWVAWLAENPLKDIIVRQPDAMHSIPHQINNDMAGRFIRGDYAPRKVQQTYLQNRIQARNRQAKTVRVHVEGIYSEQRGSAHG